MVSNKKWEYGHCMARAVSDVITLSFLFELSL